MLTRFGIVSKCTETSLEIVNTEDYSDVVVENRPRSHYRLDDSIPGVCTDIFKGTIPRARHWLKHINETIMELHAVPTDKTLCDAVTQTVYYDEIVSIQYVTEYKNKLYDLSVLDTKTFATIGGMLVYDTFHSDGSRL